MDCSHYLYPQLGISQQYGPNSPWYPYSRLFLSLHKWMTRRSLWNFSPLRGFPPHHCFSRTLLHGAVVQPISSVAHSNELTHPWTIPTLPNFTIIKFTLSLPPASTIPEFYYSHCHLEQFHNSIWNQWLWVMECLNWVSQEFCVLIISTFLIV